MASIEKTTFLYSRTLFKLALAGVVSLGAQAWAQGIYTCVDAKGRTITADRPIIECLDRTQRELTRSGLVKRQVGPALTAQEQALQEEKDKLLAEQRIREIEEKRRGRALLQRYPNYATHEQERAAAMEQINEVIKNSARRASELLTQRKAIASEFEFYVKDPSKAPSALKLRKEDNESSILAQQKILLAQEEEKKRVNFRFDEELVRLRQLWALRGTPVSAAASSAGKN
jgi:hypothetical protein